MLQRESDEMEMGSISASTLLSSNFVYEDIKYILIIQNLPSCRLNLQLSAVSVPRTSYLITCSQQ